MLFTANVKVLLRLFDEHDVEHVLVGGFAVKIISLRHLVEAKRNSDRARDRADVEELLKINEVR